MSAVVISLDEARSRARKRVVSRFCTTCKTPWSLSAVHTEQGMVILCRVCGHLRTAIPAARKADDPIA